jgi:hypothetical protein
MSRKEMLNLGWMTITETASMVSLGQSWCQPANDERRAFRYVKGEKGRERKQKAGGFAAQRIDTYVR